jgi:hypothetical protein
MGMSPEEQAELVDGIQPWMREDIKLWLAQAISMRTPTGLVVNHALIRDFDRRARLVDPLDRYLKIGVTTFESQLYGNPDLYIRMLDFLVWEGAQRAGDNSGYLEVLNSALEAGGSCWKVGTRGGVPGLEKRVPQGVQQAADAAMAVPGHAGTLLSEAWHAAFGVNPNFEKAYSKAVKAVEAAVIPVVSPNNASATLGTVLGQMRSDNDWGLDMTKEHSTHTSAHVVLGMAQALWTGQADRHAGNTYTPSTQAEAEAAVFLAVPLVQWFGSGCVARR